MLDKFFYKNNFGETLRFGEGGIIASENELRDYEWEYDSSSAASGFNKKSFEKTMPITFIGPSEKYVKSVRNRVFSIFEKDVLSKTKGKIYIGEYYLNCFIIGMANQKYLNDGRYIETTMKVYTDDPDWHKETTFEFRKTVHSVDGVDLPLNIPFDFGYVNNSEMVIFNDCIGSSPFKLEIYGPCTNPYIEIAGHVYRVNGTVESNEYIEVIADKGKDKRSIYKRAIGDNSAVNWFGHRYKEQSIFEEIPSGNVPVFWDGSFGFNLTLIESRSEPKWEYEEKEDNNDSIDYSKLLTDADGGYILDSESTYILLEG